jgi:hypothetical protein
MPGKKKKIRQMRGNGSEYVDWTGDGSHVSSHLMANKGREVFPTVFPNKPGSHKPSDWTDEPDIDKAYIEAKKRGEVIKFSSKRRAEKVAMGAWKSGQDKKEAMQHYRDNKKQSREIYNPGLRTSASDYDYPVKNKSIDKINKNK